MTSLAILEDTSQLPRCPHCHIELKMRRLRDRWVLYEIQPINKTFVGPLPGLLQYNGDYVFVPHALCCGAQPCPRDSGLARMWAKNNALVQAFGAKYDHPIYGPVANVSVEAVASRLHTRITNSRDPGLTKSDAVAVLDLMANCGISWAGGPELKEFVQLPDPELEHVAPQCTAISSKTKKQCTQRTKHSSGTCPAHRPKDGLPDSS